jgi:hypothetical protein
MKGSNVRTPRPSRSEGKKTKKNKSNAAPEPVQLAKVKTVARVMGEHIVFTPSSQDHLRFRSR